MRQYLFIVIATLVGCGGSNGDGNDGGLTDGNGTDGTVGVSHAVTIIAEPNGMHGMELVNAINAAHTSVYMTMYELDDSDVITALTQRKASGVDVQAILDGSSTNKSFNMDAYTTPNTGHVATVWSNPTFTFTHEKTVIIDGATAWIMTMNANTSSPNVNREYLAIDTDPDDVAEATAIFTADHAMHTVSPTGNLVVANNNARPKLVDLINTATKTLDVEGEEFSDTNTNGVVSAVVQAVHRGVTVHVIIGNSSAGSDVDRARQELRRQGRGDGADLRRNGCTTSNPYIHAKAGACRLRHPDHVRPRVRRLGEFFGGLARLQPRARRDPRQPDRAREDQGRHRHRLRGRREAVAKFRPSASHDGARMRRRYPQNIGAVAPEGVSWRR